ncbi:hypothetical protein MHU86_1514 [Fragilaria crotonensis]|nr:hypothetical protein MHU86_1514 [Fragilaria crotonensis]
MGNQPTTTLPPKHPLAFRQVNSEFGDGFQNNSGASVGGVTLARQGSGLVSLGGTTLHHDEPEVDYDTGSTELYKRIEGKDWDGAMAILERDPQQARTWISRKEHQSTKIRWRLLPLHATCIFRSPLALIETLIAAYPDGPQMKDDQGMLPVHLACRNGASKGVVLTLLNAFPESINVKDRKGRVPLALVETSASQNKEAVIVAMKRFQQEVSKGMPFRSGHSIIKTNQGTEAQSAPEVDYENRTILFRLILKKDWPAAAARTHSFPDEANTWIVTKGFNGNLRFLPLHKACVLSPPESLIETLVAANIEGARSRDQDGWLPLHCACFYGASEAVINTLLVAHPKGAQCKDDEGRLPLHYASLKPRPRSTKQGRSGRLPLHHACRKNASERVIRTLLRVYPRAAQIKDDQEKLPIHYACQNGANASVVNVLLSTYPESINVKNGFGYTPLAEARAVDNLKMEPVIKVLEKFKLEQDKIKVSSEENSAVEAKLAAMTERVLALEASIASMANLGKDLKANMKKTKDPLSLLSRFADKLSSIDMGIYSVAIPASQSGAGAKSSTPTNTDEQKKRGFRVLRRTATPTSPRNGQS